MTLLRNRDPTEKHREGQGRSSYSDYSDFIEQTANSSKET